MILARPYQLSIQEHVCIQFCASGYIYMLSFVANSNLISITSLSDLFVPLALALALALGLRFGRLFANTVRPINLLTYLLTCLAAWSSGNVVGRINEVTRR